MSRKENYLCGIVTKLNHMLRCSCDHQCRARVLPDRHYQKTHDDDVWRGGQVQGVVGLRRPDLEERGLHVHDEGSWSVSECYNHTLCQGR